ncbi:MAG: peptide chain release factor 1 [Ruminococcus sp.]|nr:peptide chain release factor 1 [Ruminococcus sp.]
MMSKLDGVEERFAEIGQMLTQPEVVNDSNRYTKLMKEYSRLEPIAEKYKEYKSAKAQNDEARELLSEGGMDEEMHEMVQEQLNESSKNIELLSNELKIMLLPKDPNDEKNVIVEIRGGAGGEEASLFAGSLYRMYSMYAASKGWTTQILSANETDLGGYKEISFSIEGNGAYSRMKYESGVHRVQRVPETESQGRIHTSTVTVAVLPEAEEVELELNEATELKIDVFRASGAGGQHINKTESAVRITHLPTGLVVECQDERSQYKNKDKAMRVLRSRLLDMQREAQDNEIASKRRSMVGTGDRSERIRTYNFPESRVSDHRIGLTIYKLDSFLNGAIDEIVDALALADMTARLESEEE